MSNVYSFRDGTLKEAYERLKGVREQRVAFGTGFVTEDDVAKEPITEIESDIRSSWLDSNIAGSDIQAFLIWLYNETNQDDLKVGEMADAIVDGVTNAKKVLGI